MASWKHSSRWNTQSTQPDLRCFPSAFLRIHWGHPQDSRWEGYEMRKGFTRKPQADEPATRSKNYITPSGLQRLKDEHRFLLTRDRPVVKEVVAWAAAADRWTDSLSHKANRSRGSGGPGSSESGAARDEGILRGDCALCQCRGSEPSSEHRRHRRGRSQPQPHQLGVASGPRVDEVRSRRQRSSPGAGRDRILDGAGSVLPAHFCGTVL